jgi:hypothetical protein
MDPTIFYKKLKEKQDNSQRWNSIIEDILKLYTYHFIEGLFSLEELWDFMFTYRDDHLIYNKKVWDCFNHTKYAVFFKIVYKAMDDPDPNWWNLQYKEIPT